MSDFNILPAEFSNDSRVLLRLEAILSRLWSIAEVGFEAEVVEVATRPICSSFCPGKLANLKIFGAEFWSGLFVFRVFSPFEGLKGISCLRKRALERENKKILSFFSVKIFTFFFCYERNLRYLGSVKNLHRKGIAEGIAFNVSHLDVTLVEKLILAFQYVLTQIRSHLRKWKKIVKIQ